MELGGLRFIMRGPLLLLLPDRPLCLALGHWVTLG